MSSTNIQQEEIKAIIEVIAEQTETILTFKEGQIPQIELDLVRESIRKLYSNYAILDKLNSKLADRLTDSIVANEHPKKIVKPEPEIQKEEIAPEKPVAEIKPAKEPEKIIEAPAPIVVEPEEIKPAEPEIIEPFIEPIPEPVVEAKKPEMIVEKPAPVAAVPIAEPVKEEPKAAKPSKTSVHGQTAASTGNLFTAPSTSIADKYKDETKSLYDTISAPNTNTSYAEKLQQKPITDLVKSIGLNEKFLLIRELFDGNGDEYNEAIQLLNNFSTLTQAFDYLDVLKQKFGWDESSDASLKLFDMIRRKYQK
jgi:hypothetical protein